MRGMDVDGTDEARMEGLHPQVKIEKGKSITRGRRKQVQSIL